jgi:hypothetical protein
MLNTQWHSLAALGAVVGVLVFGGIPLATAPVASQGAPNTVSTVIQVYWVNLSISAMGSPPSYVYLPGAAIAPAHTKVIITITNNDPRVGVLAHPSDAVVSGTVGGIEHIHIGSGDIVTSSLPIKGVSHTFTTQFGAFYVNVPIPPMTSAGPTVVSFTVVFPQAGSYGWYCSVLYVPPVVTMRGTMMVR